MDLHVAIIEDNARYRESLETLFKSAEGFRLAGSFPSADAMFKELESSQQHHAPSWQIAIVDIELPGTSGIEATRRLKKMLPNLTVVMLTVFEEPAVILEAIVSGADGYLLKRTRATDLLNQLREIAAGGSPLTPDVARSVLALLREHAPKKFAGKVFITSSPTRLNLTGKEQAVLQALANGHSYKQVGIRLNISIDTVRTHVRAIYRKLQVHSVAEAVARAIRERLI